MDLGLLISFHGLALEFVDSGLRNKEKVALAAISNNPHAAMYVSDRLKGDEDFARKAIEANPDFRNTLSKYLNIKSK